jgi:hypothetical protein
MPVSLNAIKRYSANHLINGVPYWSASSAAWTTHFGRARQEIQALNWQGAGGEGAWLQSVRDENTAHAAAMIAHAARSTAQTAAATLMFLRQTVLGHVDAARANGFEVNDDLSVQDRARSYLSASIAVMRQRQAEAHAADIGCAAQELLSYDAQVAAMLQGHGTALHAVQFADRRSIGGYL